MNLRLLVASLCVPLALSGAPVDDAQALLQRLQYSEAITALTDAAITGAPQPEFARYLRAIAKAAALKPEDAIKDCDAVPETSRWFRKARFLKAESLAALKRHPEAETIYREEADRVLSTTRGDQVVAALIEFAKELTKPATPGQTVSPEAQTQALVLYRRALEADAGVALRES